MAEARRERRIPAVPNGVGALVLAGSSGRIDSGRASLLAEHGVLAESVQWFGGPGQHDGPWEIPLEAFLDRVDSLAAECDRVLILGTSFGAEAALLVGALSSKVAAVVAFAPSDVVWAGVRGDGYVTSHWSFDGTPLPFVPFDDTWESHDEVPAYVDLYEASRRRFADRIDAAAIPVEQISNVLLVAGGDDQVWPSVTMADAISARRKLHGLSTTVVLDQAAGHRTILPGEPVVAGGMRMRRGGDEASDRRLGHAAWPHILNLMPPP